MSLLARPRTAPGRRRALLAACAGTAAAALLLTTTVPAAQAAWSSGPVSVTEGAPGDEAEIGNRVTGDTAVDRAGNAWYAWVQTDDVSVSYATPGHYTVRVSYRPAGGTWQQPVDLTTIDRPGGSNYPSVRDVVVDVDAAGRPTVAWPLRTGTTVALQTATRDAAGAWSDAEDVAAPVAQTAAATSDEYSVALDVAEDGTAVLGWQADEGTYVARRSAGTWGTATLVGPASDQPEVPDTVGVGQDQQGRVTVAWRTHDATADAWDVLTRSSSLTGTWSADAVTLTEDSPWVSRPSLAVDLSGAAVVTWGSGDGARAAVRAAGSDAAAWAPTTALSAGAANAAPAAPTHMTAGQGIPAVAFDEHGTATVVWPEKDPTPRVAARSVDQQGEWGEVGTVAEGTAANAPARPLVTAGRDGALTVAWTTSVAASVVGGGLVITGGEVHAAERPSTDAPWDAPQTWVTPENGSYGTASALGWDNLAGLTLSGDALGNTLLGWAPYKSAVLPGDTANQSVDQTVTPATALDWTARGVTGSGNLRSWLGYLSTDWAAGGTACPQGVHGTVVSGGAVRPSASDPESWRFAQTDAYVDAATGKTIVQYTGTLAWVLDAHCIHIELTNPRLEIAADGASARIYSDGTASGSMADAIAGHPTSVPVTNVRLLELDLSGVAPHVSADGTVRSWTRVRATLAAAAAVKLSLSQYSLSDFGRLTFTVPTNLPTRTGSGTGDGDDDGGSPAPVASRLSLTSTSTRFAQPAEVSAVVTAPGTAPTGTVTVREGTTTLATAKVTAGRASLTLPRTLRVGTHALVATFVPTPGSGVSVPAAARATVTVTRARARIAKVTAKRLAVGRKAKVKVVLKPLGGQLPSGKVLVKAGKKTLGKAKLKAKKHGTRLVATITTKKLTKKLAKAGRTKVVYRGDSTFAKTTVKGKKIRR